MMKKEMNSPLKMLQETIYSLF